MKKLLLTGYEPFLKFKTNPTQSAVESLEGKVIGDYKIIGKVYPVAFKEINALIEQDIEEIEPDAIVSLGLASGIQVFILNVSRLILSTDVRIIPVLNRMVRRFMRMVLMVYFQHCR